MRKPLIPVFVLMLGVVPTQAQELPGGLGSRAWSSPLFRSTEFRESVTVASSVPTGSVADRTSDYKDKVGEDDLNATSPVAPTSFAQANTQAPVQQKSMAATVLFWLLIPGGGNFYNGAIGKGFIELGGTAGGIALIATAYREECVTVGRFTSCDDAISSGQAWGGLGVIAGFRIWGLISAINRTQDINSGKISPFERLRFTFPTKKDGFKVVYSQNF